MTSLGWARYTLSLPRSCPMMHAPRTEQAGSCDLDHDFVFLPLACPTLAITTIMSAIASTSRLLLTSNVSATRHALACLHPHGSAQRFASTSTVQPSSAPEDGGKPSSVQSYKGAGKKGWYQTQMEAMKRQEEKKLALPVKVC